MFILKIKSDALSERIHPVSYTTFLAALHAAQAFVGLGVRVTIAKI